MKLKREPSFPGSQPALRLLFFSPKKSYFFLLELPFVMMTYIFSFSNFSSIQCYLRTYSVMEEEVINTLLLIYHYSTPEEEKYLFQAV